MQHRNLRTRTLTDLLAALIFVLTGVLTTAADAADFEVDASDDLFEEFVRISWTPSESKSSFFRVYRWTQTQEWELLSVASSNESFYLDTTGDPNETYDYAVGKYDIGSDVEEEFEEDEGGRIVFQPTAVEASDGEFSDLVRISWYDRSEVEAGFEISRKESTEPESAYTVIGEAGPDMQGYDDSSAAPGVDYDYCVVALDSEGFESVADCDTGTRGFILAPTNVDASDGVHLDKVVITWTDQTDEEFAYRVYRNGALLDELDPDTESYTDTDSLGIEHDYCVAAVREMYVAPDTLYLESVWICDLGIGGDSTLAAPTGVAASDEVFDDRIQVTWEDTSDLEDKFLIFRDDDLIAEVDANTTVFDDFDIDPGATATYCVAASSDSGGVSVQICDEGERAVVLAPTNVLASAGDYETHVELTWESSSTSVVLFRIEREGVGIKNVSGDRRSCSDFEIAAGVDSTYQYCVVAVTALEDESPSACASGYRTLAAPTSPEATDDLFEDRVTITWSDESEAESGYNVYRRDPNNQTLSLLGSTDEDSQAFVDETGTPGTSYEYSITAFDLLGESAAVADSGRRELHAPTSVEASQGEYEDRILLTWNDESSAEVEYWIQRNDGVSVIVPANQTTYTDSSVSIGATHDYDIRASDDYGDSKKGSAEGFTQILAPGSVNATNVYDDRVVVTWIDHSDVETGYNIYRGDELLGELSANTTMYIDENVSDDVEYEYCVEAEKGDEASLQTCDFGISPAAVSAATPLRVLASTDALEASDGRRNARFGHGIAIDGDLALVGAPEGQNPDIGAGVVYAYHWDGTQWTEGDRFSSNSPNQAARIGQHIEMDGDLAVVAAPGDPGGGNNRGKVFIFEYDQSNEDWFQVDSFVDPDPANNENFGAAVAIHNGTVVIQSTQAPDFDGRVFVYERKSDGSWPSNPTVELSPSSPRPEWGRSLAISNRHILIGDPMRSNEKGAVAVYSRNSDGEWDFDHNVEFDDPKNGDLFGWSLSMDGVVALAANRVTDENPNSEQRSLVFGFDTDSEVWTNIQEIGPSEDQLRWGDDVCMSGGIAMVLAASDTAGVDTGRYFVYAKDPETGSWNEVEQIEAGEMNSRSTCAISEGRVILGAQATSEFTGAIYPFELLASPAFVDASDGVHDGRVQVRWTDRAPNEDGYLLYRDGVRIDEVGANVQSYTDFDAAPGSIHEYCVVAYTNEGLRSSSESDFGWRPPAGSISGRISTLAGAPVEGVSVCLDPAPNRSILLDGSEGHIQVEGAAMPDSSVTVELWVKTSEPNISNGTLVSYAVGSESESFVIRNASNLRVVVDGESTGATGVGITDGEWHHVAVTWENVLGTTRLYVDGVLQVEETLSQGAVLDSGGTLVLGRNQTNSGLSSSNVLNGQVDEVRIWNEVRDVASIESSRTHSLIANEAGLVAYWPIDAGSGPAIADLTDGNRYGLLREGAFWTDDASPIEVCAVSDIEGNYAFTGIRHGSSATFKVTPSLSPRAFSPAFKRIVLSTESPVENEVGFHDVTSFALSGFVRYQDTSCYVEGARILVDDVVVGLTDASGAFNVSVQPGSRDIEVDFGNHTFVQKSLSLLVDQNIAGLEFLDATKRRLTGRVGGGCDFPIGTVTLEIAAENGCIDPIEITADADFEALRLLPQTYIVRVTDVEDVPDELDRADILAFYENLGPQIADLGEGDLVLNFIYRAPLSVLVEGFPDPVCDGDLIRDPESGVEFPGVPVIEQGEEVPLTISAYEDYGNGNLCPVDSGKVTVFDGIIDEEDDPKKKKIVDGRVTYKTIGNTPNIFVGRRDSQGNDRSFQKPLTVVVDVEGREALQQTHWCIVTGNRPRTGTFVTAAAEPFPLLILRDPPGDGSYAYLEEGTSWSVTASVNFAEGFGTDTQTKIVSGLQFDKGVAGYTTETRIGTDVHAGFKFGIEATQQGGVRYTVTTTEKFSTSDGDTFVGDDGDVYMGIGLNLVFAKTDVLEIDETNCKLLRSQSVAFGGDSEDPIETVYLYTDSHIRDTVIPQLEELAVLEPDSADVFESHVENWESHRFHNGFSKALATFEENRSFSAGADFEYEKLTSTQEYFRVGVRVFAEKSAGVTFDFFETGSGGETVAMTNWSFEFGFEGGGDFEQSTKVGYVLSDDDIGDYFSVDVSEDSRYRTPVFSLVSGRSSCPWEDGTQPRDTPLLGIEPPVLQDVSPERPGVFTLSLTNASPSEELRECTLMPVQTSNPGGAVLSINGQPFNSGRSFFIEPDQTQEVTLTVERGPRRYFYEDLKIQVVAPCEFENFRDGAPLQLAEEVKFSIGFAAPCSDVTLFEPRSGWAFDLAESEDTGDTLRLTLDDFELQLSETDSLESVGAEYRRVDTEDWFPIGAEIQRDDLPTFPSGDPKSVEIDWNVSNVPEGAYELQAFTRCSGGRAFSTVATGIIDRTRPKVIGSPQPADTVLALGDGIFVKFNEKIDCETVTPDRVTLFYTSDDTSTVDVAFDAVCDGRKISLVPNEAQLALLEGKTLTARVEGIEDIVGNPMEAPVAWNFEVRRGAFTWTEESIYKEAAYRNPGSIKGTIVNGTSLDLDFELSDLPEWLTPGVSSGTLVAGQNREIAFAIADTLPEGVHLATVTANVPDADNPIIVAPLDVRVDIACMPPNWSPRPADFEHSMTAVLQLSIDGAVSEDGADVVAGFVGNQLRGVGSPVFMPDLDEYIVFMTLYSNRAQGENVRFQIFDGSDCLLYGAADRVLRFESDRRHGTPESPIVLQARETPAGDPQSVSLVQGWTWFSVNKVNQDMSIFNVLGDLNPEAGDLVKSQTAFSQFDETVGWSGSLDNVEITRGYAIRLSEAGTIFHEGTPADPGALIPVVDGWNWIGYPPDQEMGVDEALSNLSPEDGDVIKSQFGFAEYVESEETWLGSLTTMKPGLGYKLYLDDALQSSSFLRYPIPTEPVLLARSGAASTKNPRKAPAGLDEKPSPGGREVETAVLATHSGGENPPNWSLSAGYQFNMTVTARVQVDGADVNTAGAMLGAFVGGELRGVADLRHISALGKRYAFLMVHSNVAEGETVSFHFYDPIQDTVLEVSETMVFDADLVGGTLESPFLFHAASRDPDDGASTRPLSFSLGSHFPSPARANGPVTLRWALPTQERVVVHLYDVRGRNVAKLVDETMLPGWYSEDVDIAGFASGVYFYRIQAGAFDEVRKLAIVR